MKTTKINPTLLWITMMIMMIARNFNVVEAKMTTKMSSAFLHHGRSRHHYHARSSSLLLSSLSSSCPLLSLSSSSLSSSSTKNKLTTTTTTSLLSTVASDITTPTLADPNGDDNNAWLMIDGLPKFGSIDPKQLTPAITSVLHKVETNFNQLEQDLTSAMASTTKVLSYDDILPKLEQITNSMSYVWGVAGHLNGVDNSDTLRIAYEENQSKIVEISNKMQQSRILYDALIHIEEQQLNSKTTNDNDDNAELFEYKQRQRAIEQSIRNMKLGGVGLIGIEKERYNVIQMRLATLSNTFSNNILDETKAFSYTITDPTIMTNVPETAKAMWSNNHITYVKQQEEKVDGDNTVSSTSEEEDNDVVDDNNDMINKGPWRITLAGPSYVAAMSHIPDRDIREQLYKANIQRASEQSVDDKKNNIPLIYEILSLKFEMAQLLGYNNYAELSLASKMAPSVQSIQELSDLIMQKALPNAIKELEEITQYARNNSNEEYYKNIENKLMPWDITYWSERYKESKFQLTDEETRPYFALSNVLDGMFQLVKRIFQIECVAVDTINHNNVDVWHPDVQFFKVYDINTKDHIASFYLDPFSRPENKRGGAWMDICIGKSAALHHDVPVAYMVCNSSPPGVGKPSLMTFYEVETLFHEFGHALQHMLTKATVGDVAGINGVEWDAVELPSQFMENWCYDHATIYGFAKHWETGEPMPEEMFEKLKLQKTYNAGMMSCRQLLFGQLDIELHSNYKPPKNDNDKNEETIFDVHQRMAKTYTPYNMPLKEDRFLCTFSHIFGGGYAAGYYSYKWAEVMSSDAFGAFEEVDFNDKNKINEIGMKFRNTILSYGGGIDPMTSFIEFRGRQPNPDALLRHCGLDK